MANLDPLLSQISQTVGCQWAHSNQYFADTPLLPHLGIVPILTADSYVQTSFRTGNILGADIQPYTKDNTPSDQILCYRIPTKVMTIDTVSIDFSEVSLFSFHTARDFLKTMPWIAIIIFAIITHFLPASIATILNYINVAAMGIVVLVYAYAMTKYLIRLVMSKKHEVGGQKIAVVQPQDTNALSEAQVKGLIPLKEFGVDQVVCYKGMLYFRQTVRTKDDTKIATQAGSIIAYLSSPAFTSLFA